MAHHQRPSYLQASCAALSKLAKKHFVALAPAATDELTDVQLQYYSPENLCLEPQHLPKNWPRPREPLYPFSGGLVDYCRLVAPGVLVGVGWKAARPGKDVGRRFLYFMLVRTE